MLSTYSRPKAPSLRTQILDHFRVDPTPMHVHVLARRLRCSPATVRYVCAELAQQGAVRRIEPAVYAGTQGGTA